RPQGEGNEGDVDQEREPPGRVVDDQSADDRAKERQGGRRRGPQPEGTRPRGSGKGGRDDRQRSRDEQGTGRSLEEPRADQELEVRSDAAQDRDQPEG